MGILGPNDDIENIKKRFPDNILIIELSLSYYTHSIIVDVPVLFHYQSGELKTVNFMQIWLNTRLGRTGLSLGCG